MLVHRRSSATGRPGLVRDRPDTLGLTAHERDLGALPGELDRRRRDRCRAWLR